MVLAGILASFPLTSMGYYVLELRGGSHIYATDLPIRKGRLTLFHRYPDGVYMSLSSSEVVKIETATEPPPAKAADKFAPGELRYVGGDLHGPGSDRPPAEHLAPGSEAPAYSDNGYAGYYGDYYYGGGGGYSPPRPVPHPPAGGSNIGPNGFPIIAPPGSPGSVPPPIGANGFPIIAPQPPVAAPRKQ